MAKLTVLAAIFAALVAAASATTYTTVVTTTTVDDDEVANPEAECQQQIKQMQTRHCMQFMMQRGSGGRAYDEAANPEYEQDEHMMQCCSEMRRIRQNCRCEAIRQMVRQQQQRGVTQEMQQMLRQRAEMIPRMCGGPQAQCSIGSM